MRLFDSVRLSVKVRRILRLVGAAFACCLVIASQAVANPTWPKGHEIRGVWLTNVDSDVLFSRDALETGLDRIENLNFNTVYPTVWNWGYTLFPSQIAEATYGVKQGLYPDLESQGRNEALEAEQDDRDMLQELIDLAHTRELSVIPWLEFGFMAPADSPLVQQHPEWVSQRHDGSQIKNEGTHPRVWLNPFHPEVRKFLIDLTLEVVQTYDIEGIQYDDHLGLPVEYGYDPYTLKLYRSQHEGRNPPEDIHDPDWMQWRADLISSWVKDLVVAVKAENPNVLISLSPNPAQWAYDTFLQDWVRWEQQGWIEELVVQVYRDNMRRFRYELSQPELKRANKRIPVVIGILSGLKNRPTPIDLLEKQVKKSRDRHYAGVSFFFYESLWTPKDGTSQERLRALTELFPSKAVRSTQS